MTSWIESWPELQSPIFHSPKAIVLLVPSVTSEMETVPGTVIDTMLKIPGGFRKPTGCAGTDRSPIIVSGIPDRIQGCHAEATVQIADREAGGRAEERLDTRAETRRLDPRVQVRLRANAEVERIEDGVLLHVRQEVAMDAGGYPTGIGTRYITGRGTGGVLW